MSEKIVHLVKLCFGIKSVVELQNLQKERVKQGIYPQPEHLTRSRPRRFEEVLKGGSIYWIIDGLIQVRQKIVHIENRMDSSSKKVCALVFDPVLIYVEPTPRRPFQGWRYLENSKRPKDLINQPQPSEARRIHQLLTQNDISKIKFTASPNITLKLD